MINWSWFCLNASIENFHTFLSKIIPICSENFKPFQSVPFLPIGCPVFTPKCGVIVGHTLLQISRKSKIITQNYLFIIKADMLRIFYTKNQSCNFIGCFTIRRFVKIVPFLPHFTIHFLPVGSKRHRYFENPLNFGSFAKIRRRRYGHGVFFRARANDWSFSRTYFRDQIVGGSLVILD